MRTRFPVSVILALAAAAVYWPVAGHAFLNYDDHRDIYENPHITGRAADGGLTAGGVRWALTTGDNSNWIPLTRLSWMVDWQLFGRWAGGHHLVDAGLHAASGIVLFLVLEWMTGRRWPSAFVAAMFLLHPLHVESVAWAVERKDTLSGLFWMLTLGAYGWYVGRPGVGRYALVFVALGLGLMAKPMLVTLPLVLLLLDWWPLGRVRGGPAPAAEEQALRQNSGTEARRSRKPASLRTSAALCPAFSVARLVAEKVPLLVLAAASSIVTYLVQSSGGAVTGTARLPIIDRITNALVSYVAYLGKTVAPVNLSILYPFDRPPPVAEAAGAGLLLAAGTFLAVILRRRRPYAAVGWFWYMGSLVPVIGLVQVGAQAMADRYTYLPLVGIFIAAAWGAEELAAAWRLPQRGLAAAGAAAVGACMVVAAVQVRHWADSETVFRHAVQLAASNWRARFYLGLALSAKGKTETAIRVYREAIQLKPDNADAMRYLGLAFVAKGQTDEAIHQYREAIRVKPDFAEAHCDLGIALAAKGQKARAAAEYREAIRLKPDLAAAHSNLGIVLADLGNVDEAIRQYREAIRINPDLLEAHQNLGNALAARDPMDDESIRQYREVLRINPDCAEAYHGIGLVLAARGLTDEAIDCFREAIRLKPDFREAHQALANVLARRGQAIPPTAVTPEPPAAPRP